MKALAKQVAISNWLQISRMQSGIAMDLFDALSGMEDRFDSGRIDLDSFDTLARDAISKANDLNTQNNQTCGMFDPL